MKQKFKTLNTNIMLFHPQVLT